MINLINPKIKIMDSTPGSLGSIDYYMVMSDEHEFIPDIDNYDKLAENFESKPMVKNKQFDDTFLILHSTNPSWGEQIKPLKVNDQLFSSNITAYDECLTHHCLALKLDLDRFIIKSGTYLTCENEVAPSSFLDMPLIDHYQVQVREFTINKEIFWSLYSEAVKEWAEHVKFT
jgi:hypothetical protein